MISIIRSSTADSPIPNNLMYFETSLLVDLEARYGSTDSLNIGLISLGGPGKSISIFPLSSIIQPGAVPLLFLTIMQSSGISDCLRLFFVIGLWTFSKYALMSFTVFSSVTR